MPDYSKGKIYKITSPSLPGECYIGSTTCILHKRMITHKCDYNRNRSGITSKLIMCNGDAIIELIEDYPCASRSELERREGIIMKEYINNDEMDDVVNYHIAGRTSKENYYDKREKKRADGIANRKKNIDRYRAYDKLYDAARREERNLKNKVKITCEHCGSLNRRDTIRRHQRSLKCQAIQEQKSKNGFSVA